VQAVSKHYTAFTAVDRLSFDVPKGSFFSILGPSGCGKTTLLRMIAGFILPDQGEIAIGGRAMNRVPPNQRPVNMVFQHLALFPMMNVGDNVGYGLVRRGLGRAEVARKAEDMLERVGLPGIAGKRIDQLSGGQKQRVAIARSLVLEPTLLLLDEPLGALDLKLREHMKIELKQLQHAVGTTFVYITHDQSEALVMSDRVAVMNHGRFEQVGTPQELYYRPQTAFVAGFVGNSNRLDGSLLAGANHPPSVKTALLAPLFATPMQAGLVGNVSLFVRPESIQLARAAAEVADCANRLHGLVESVLFDGANSSVRVREAASGCALLVALPQTPGHTRRARAGLCGRQDVNPLAPKRLALYLLLAPAVIWLLLLIVLPQVEMALLSFRARTGPGEFAPSLNQYATFFAEPLYWNNFLRTALMSLIATVLALVLAFPVAWTIAKVARGRVKTLMLAATLLPFWASELVRTLGWLILLRTSGVIPQLL
jgi:spermidine/putrescine transport system ATP-binding protein